MENLSEKERFDLIQVGSVEDLGTIVVTQKQIDENRKVLDWPDAPYPVLHTPIKDSTKKLFPPRVNARSIRQFFNPPIPGKKRCARCFATISRSSCWMFGCPE